MDLDPHASARTTPTRLVVADWRIDPETVMTTCRARDREWDLALHIVVPAWLHGLDWAGDPWASVPCAQRQLARITHLCTAAGLRVASAEVGDPDPLSAIGDAVANGPIEEILLFARGRHVAAGYPLSVARRAQRLTGLPVRRFAAALAPRPRRRLVLGGAHCEPAQQPQIA